MSKTIFDPATKAALFARLDGLTERTVPLWGQLKPNQMVRHLREALKVNTGEIQPARRDTFFTRTFICWFTLNAKIPPVEQLKKKPIHTFDEINIVKRPIPADDLATEKRLYAEALDRVIKEGRYADRSPTLGRMSIADHGRLMYSHMHWHLTQFGL